MIYRPVELCPYGFDAEDKKPAIQLPWMETKGEKILRPILSVCQWWLNSEGLHRLLGGYRRLLEMQESRSTLDILMNNIKRYCGNE